MSIFGRHRAQRIWCTPLYPSIFNDYDAAVGCDHDVAQQLVRRRSCRHVSSFHSRIHSLSTPARPRLMPSGDRCCSIHPWIVREVLPRIVRTSPAGRFSRFASGSGDHGPERHRYRCETPQNPRHVPKHIDLLGSSGDIGGVRPCHAWRPVTHWSKSTVRPQIREVVPFLPDRRLRSCRRGSTRRSADCPREWFGSCC